ncbi:glycogen synthase [Patescibacteria group bacterium]|nr:glycogen synthase [Patescibacteria group bacterium]
MKVLFVASEVAPIAKVGGLADVVGSLPKTLKKMGVNVSVALPFYEVIKIKKKDLKLIQKDILVRFKQKRESFNLWQTFLPKSRVPLFLIENKNYFPGKYVYPEADASSGGSEQEFSRFLFLSVAAIKVAKLIKAKILHCHDWHIALIPFLVKKENSKVKTLLTIHNLRYQGIYPNKLVNKFLGTNFSKKKVNCLKLGILTADFLNTVSPTYSREILTKRYGENLNRILLKRKKDLFGILNGIDQDQFDSNTDPNLKVNYSFSTVNKKRENKADLQKILKLPQSQKTPLFSFIGRLTFQKGVDLISQIVPDLVSSGCQLVILGVGERKYEKKLLKLAKRYPKNVSVQIKFDPVLAQKIYAGSDLFLMPSRFEPCGLGQLIAQRYGTIPIARKTGGLVDTIEQEKTGFLFKKYKKQAFLKIIKKALKFYQNQKKWRKLIKKAMEKDFSWKKSARKYLKLYKILALDF